MEYVTVSIGFATVFLAMFTILKREVNRQVTCNRDEVRELKHRLDAIDDKLDGMAITLAEVKQDVTWLKRNNR